MNRIHPKFTTTQWCLDAKIDDAAHSLLVADIQNKDFYGGHTPESLGGKRLNAFSIGYHTDDALPNYDDERFLTSFKNALYDYTYHTVFLDLPVRNNSEEGYRTGLSAMLSMLAAYQPQAKLVWVDSGTKTEIGRRMTEQAGGIYAEMTGKKYEDLNSFAAELAKEPVGERPLKVGCQNGDMNAKYREDMYWAIQDNAQYAENDPRPRVLLIGDSICFGYYHPTRELLESDYIVDAFAISFAPADPAILRNLIPFLKLNHYDLIHINVGMHQCQHDTCEGGYAVSLEALLDGIHAATPDTKLCFATTTTIMKQDNLDEFDEQTFTWVTDRNNDARRICAERNIPIDDLFRLCYETKPEKVDTHHFKDSKPLAEQVASHVRSLFA